jgi:dipeptidyl aminopeptidase/acylaminoacyl peptidase
MHDDQIRSLLRALEEEQSPNPAFADALYGRLQLAADERRRSRAPLLLLAAALLVGVVATVAIGSGLLKLPELVEASGSPVASTSAVAVASPSTSPSGSQRPAPSASVEPSASPDTAIPADSVLFAEADGLRIRSEPVESGELLATMRRGQLMAATGQSRDSDGTTWYEVRIGPGELAGWVAAGPNDAWLRLVDDGAVTFACSGCGDGSSVVSVTPFGDADITTIARAEELSEWAWSPDGTRLVGSRGGTTLPYHVVLIAPDGTELTDLGIGTAATWSPDGARLAWLAEDGLVVTDEEFVPTTVDVGGLSTGLPLWSPDGLRFATVATEDPGIIDPPSSLYVVPVAGGEPVRLTTPGYVGGLTWSPDGAMIGFTTVDLSGEAPTRAFVLSADGGEPRPLLDGAAVASAPIWSPAGDQLAIATAEGLILAAGDGTGATVLVAAEPDQFIAEVSWSPSGRWLLYSMSTGREPTLFVVPRDGSSPPRAISPSGAGGQQADWQPLLVPLR